MLSKLETIVREDPRELGYGWSATPIRATPEAKNGDVVVSRFGDEVTLKRFVRLDARHVQLRPDSHNPEHEPIAIDLA